MKVTTALNHERRFKNIVGDIHRGAISAGKSHTAILDERTKSIFNDPAWSKVPQWVRSRVLERDHVYFHNHYYPADSIGHAIHPSSLEQRIKYEIQEAISPGSVHPNHLRPFAYIRWQLRLDGEFVTSDEVSAKRAAGDNKVWDRVEGTHIWNHNHKPYSPWKRTND